jgi:hypothetical protein
VLLLGGASDFLLAAAHAFLVEAVRERPADYGRGRTEGTDPRAVVVDGGNGISPYLFARLARDAREDTELLLPRVRLARAFTAYQFVSLLTDSLQAELAREPADLIVVMNVRELFEDEALANDEARQLMRQAAQGLRALAQRHRVPCVVTSPAPARAVRPLSLERIAQKSATRAVLDLSFSAVAGARQERPLGAAGLEPAGRRIDPEQRGLEAWAEMPGRSRIVGAGPAGCPRGRDLIEAHWRPSRAKAQRAGNGRDRPGRQAETASG